MKSYHAVAVEDVLRDLNADLNGLTTDEAGLRLERFGPNELAVEERVSPFKLLAEQFTNILIVILIGATILSAAVGELLDAAVILAIVVAAAGLGFLQEYRAERALEALKKMVAPTVTVLRGGREHEIPSRELVPGDLVILKTGDKVAADCRIVESVSMQVDEAPLTGESVPVAKTAKVLPERLPLPERVNLAFSGTTVTYGHGRGIVVSTGMATEFGKIAKETAAVIEEETPLERRMKDVGRLLVYLSLGVVAAVAVVGLVREYFIEGSLGSEFVLEMVLFGISLAVAAVPEALPAIVTGSLAIGMHQMAKRNALVRRMPAVETLGSTTVICSDKTGTLTKGEMTVRGLYVEGAYLIVSGVGYDPRGEIEWPDEGASFVQPATQELATAFLLCNDAELEQVEGRWRVLGDPTEGALIVLAGKAGLNPEEIRRQHPRVGEVPFSSERKRMSTVHSLPSGKRNAFMKGAPEIVLERCTRIRWNGRVEPLTHELRRRVLQENEEMASDALRVLAVAYKDLPGGEDEYAEETVENELVFLGLAGMIDPPRTEAVEAVKVTQSIGMKTVMITGDHKLTAIAIAREMGIYREGDIALTGEDVDRMSEEELEKIVDKVTVYARVSPIHKLKIVKAWKAKGEIVAVTGDGVNDAPAIKHASIGVAMGITGTEVTKEASDLILGDDNFATIVKAIELGRWIVDNIKKYLTYLLRCNIVEVVVLGGAVLAGYPLPLLPAQILWINLTTDGLPALALGVGPPNPDIMKQPPRDPSKSIFDREVKVVLIVLPLVLSPIILLSFVLSLPEGLAVARTRLFFLFVFFELIVALGSASLRYQIYQVKPHRLLLLTVLSSFMATTLLLHPALIQAFDLTYIPTSDWLVIGLVSILPLPVIELLKCVLRRSGRHSQ